MIAVADFGEYPSTPPIGSPTIPVDRSSRLNNTAVRPFTSRPRYWGIFVLAPSSFRA